MICHMVLLKATPYCAFCARGLEGSLGTPLGALGVLSKSPRHQSPGVLGASMGFRGRPRLPSSMRRARTFFWGGSGHCECVLGSAA